MGDGPDRPHVEALTAELGLRDSVQLPGFEPNPYKYMARAALFVLSSRYEGLPNALIEAQACGVPVVSTDCPTGPREILEGGVCGPLVGVGDADAMCGAMLGVLSDVRLAESYVLAAEQRLERFTPDKAYQAYAALIGSTESSA
jgi:glycosyltransferase involved in cell wall biosynthesis